MADQWEDDSLILTTALTRDETDDVPDAWDEEPEEKPKKADVEDKSKTLVKAPSTTKNKQPKKKFVGDEPANDEEFLESLKQSDRLYTAEELAELRERAELQIKVGNLKMAADLIGAGGDKDSLDNLNLVFREEFIDYSFRLYNRLELLSKSEFYPEFIDDLLTGLTKHMSLEAVKNMSATLQTILLRKQNEKKKPGIKKPVKPQLKADRRNEMDSFVGDGIVTMNLDSAYDEDNDFM